MINDRLFFPFMKEGLVEKEERAKMVGCSPLALKKLFTGKEPDCWLLRDIYLNRLKKKKGMVAVNWIIKSSVSM